MNPTNTSYIQNRVTMLYSRRGIPAGVTHSSKAYVIVFPLQTIAEKAHKIVNEKTKFEIIHRQDVRIDTSLMELGFDPRHHLISQTLLDDEAYLYIEKWYPTKRRPYQPIKCNLFDRNLLDVVLYPFTKNIGLVLPLEIIDDTKDHLILSSKIIQPSIHMDLFRKELENIHKL